MPAVRSRAIEAWIYAGFGFAGVVLAIFGFALYRGLGADEARALTFATLVLASIGLIFTNRSRSRSAFATLQSPNVALWWITTGAVVGPFPDSFSSGAERAISPSVSWTPPKLCFVFFAGFTTFGLFEAFKFIRVSRL